MRGKAGRGMLALIALFMLTLFTWGVAIWATMGEGEPAPDEQPDQDAAREEPPADRHEAA
jgi:hypothetical protein